MESSPTNPLVVAMFFVLRCLVPLVIMLGISYLLKKLGLISAPPSETPKNKADNSDGSNGPGGYAHV